MPHLFPEPFGPHHEALAQKLAAHPLLLVLAFRGWGKSTIVTLAETLRQLAVGNVQFIVLTSRTRSQTTQLVLQLRLEIESNEKLIKDYPEMTRGAVWQSDHFALGTGQEVLGRSMLGAVRGLRSLRNRRPQLWVLDDLQELQDARNPDRIDATMDFIMGTVLPGMDATRQQVRVLGTKMSEDCVISRLERTNPTFRLDAEDAQRQPTEPQRFPRLKLDQLKAVMGTDRYQREYLNTAVGKHGLVRRSWIKHYRPEEAAGLPLLCAVYWDPATAAATAKGDYKAIVTLGLHRETGRIFVLRTFIRRAASPDEQAAEFCQHWLEVVREHQGLGVLGYESNGFQVLMAYPVERRRQELGMAPLPAQKIVNTAGKELRLQSLVPLLEQGRVLFLPDDPDQQLLADQWVYWPHKGKDGPDAMAGAWGLLQGYADDNRTLVTYRESKDAWVD